MDDPGKIYIAISIVVLTGMISLFWFISKRCGKGVLLGIGIGLWLAGQAISSPPIKEMRLIGGLCTMSGFIGGILGLFDVFRKKKGAEVPQVIRAKFMNDISPQTNQSEPITTSATPAIWSICLSGFVWVALITFAVVVGIINPADENRATWFICGGICLLITAILFVSVALAVIVLIRRRCGQILAIISLVLSTLPVLFLIVTILRAILKPSNMSGSN
jgi:hypothetical protein